MQHNTKSLWWFLALTLLVSCSDAASGNCTSDAGCDEEAPPCPPDSRTVAGGGCQCAPEQCMQPVCHAAQRRLLRAGSGRPGDCCDVFECHAPAEHNCSDVVCPVDKTVCPDDSYHLPARQSLHDCCSVPQGCQCLPKPCEEASCAADEVVKIIRKGTGEPGSCCTLYKCESQVSNVTFGSTCTDNGVERTNGEEWKSDACVTCRCEDGITLCDKEKCTPLPSSCESEEIPEGKCCPECKRDNPGKCFVSPGKAYDNGETWQPEPCTSCTCSNGTARCWSTMCEVRCANPQVVPGECCPVCEGCLIVCPYGYEYDKDGKELCKCAHPNSTCPPLYNCSKNCSQGYKLNKDGCEICKCIHHCKELTDCNKHCAYGFRTNERGCPICKCRTSPDQVDPVGHPCNSSDGVVHEDGESWTDTCQHCNCIKGEEICQSICPTLKCTNPIYEEHDDCCPKCPEENYGKECVEDGKNYQPGEQWIEDACTQCTCEDGKKACTKKVCLQTCNKPRNIQGQCCPDCEDDKPESLMTVFDEHTLYFVTTAVLICLAICFLIYILWKKYHSRKLKMYPSGNKDSFKSEPYNYKYSYDSLPNKSTPEKSAPV